MLVRHDLYNTHLLFPFFKRFIPDLGWVYVLFAAFVCVAWTNAVNLTDGLDGLAISVFGVAAAALTALTYVSGHRVFAEYLQLSERCRRSIGGADDLLRRAGRREPRVPLVQLVSRPTSSWATSARSPSAARSAPSRCSSSRNSSW